MRKADLAVTACGVGVARIEDRSGNVVSFRILWLYGILY